MRRSSHFRALGSKDRASGRERNVGLCFGRRPPERSLPAQTGLASPRGVPGLRPKPSGPRACVGRGPPRRGLTRAARAPAPPPPQRRADWSRRRPAAGEGRLSLVAPARLSSSRSAPRNVSGVPRRGLSGWAAGPEPAAAQMGFFPVPGTHVLIGRGTFNLPVLQFPQL